jgi:alpha-maltose-1-phosphate synthase
MRRDVQGVYGAPNERIRIIHNGIDLQQYRPTPDPAVLAELGIASDVPYVLFVGRITRQKGIIHLVNANRHMRGDVQVVCVRALPTRPGSGAS